MALGDPEVSQLQGQTLGCHGRTTVGVDGQRRRCHSVLGDALCDESLAQFGALTTGQHPANHIAAEHVHEHVQAVVEPWRGVMERAM